MRLPRERWLDLLAADPRPALLESSEPSARFVTLTAVLGLSPEDPDVREARAAVLADPGIAELVRRLPRWAPGLTFGGHNSPAFPPNLLRLLHLLGLRGGDSPAVERVLDEMLRHQSEDGRFLTPYITNENRCGYAAGDDSRAGPSGCLLTDIIGSATGMLNENWVPHPFFDSTPMEPPKRWTARRQK